MSRLANSSPITWKDIFKHNKAHLLHSLTDFEKHFTEAKEYVAKEEWDNLIAWMKKANELHNFL